MSLVQVFLSSTTKDLASYREAVSEAIRCMEGYHCVRMEDFSAHDCPPLDLCLRKVEECEVYIGIVGHLYGSCPEEGGKSYTELEYDKATELRKPRLMFLAPDDFSVRRDYFEDADKQQRQELFRARIDRDRLRREFKTPEKLAVSVLAALHNWEREESAALEEQSKEAQTPVGGGTQLATVDAALDSITAKGDEASAQRMKAVKALMKSLAAGQFERVQAASDAPTEFDVARLFLSAKALFAERCSSESLTPHEANYLYLHREALRLGSREGGLLWDALLGQDAGITPGWYWFGGLTPKDTEQMLWSSALANSSEFVRKNAFCLLQKARVATSASGLAHKDLYEAMLRNSPEDQTAFFRYLEKSGKIEDIGHLDIALGDERLNARDVAANAKWHIRARVEPERALSDLLQMPEPPSGAVSAIGEALPQVGDDVLFKGLTCTVDSLRLALVTELVRRGKLPTGAARDLLGDDSLRVREICYKFLIGQGERFEAADIRKALRPPEAGKPASPRFVMLTEDRADIDEVIRRAMEGYPYDELVGLAHWLNLDGPIAYQVLAERHFDRVASQVRNDLGGKFERLREGWLGNSVNDMMAELHRKGLTIGDEQKTRQVLKKVILERTKYTNELDDGIYVRFAGAAIAGLVGHGEPPDVAFGRELLANRKKDTFYGEAEGQAVRLIARFGDGRDVEALVGVAREAYGETKELAAKTALRLSPGTEGVAKQFAGIKDIILFRLALESVQETSPANARAHLQTFLGDAENFKRMAALRILVKTAKTEDLESLLRAYMAQPTYYYNVVCWLDRVLFSPSPFREAYVGELECA